LMDAIDRSKKVEKDQTLNIIMYDLSPEVSKLFYSNPRKAYDISRYSTNDYLKIASFCYRVSFGPQHRNEAIVNRSTAATGTAAAAAHQYPGKGDQATETCLVMFARSW